MKRGGVPASIPEYECEVNLHVDIPLAIRTSQPVILSRALAPAEEVLLDEYLNTLGEPMFVEGRLDSARQQLIRDMIMICYDYTKKSEDPIRGVQKTGYFMVDDCKIVDSITTIEIHKGPNHIRDSLDCVIRENVLKNHKEVFKHEETAEVEYFLQNIQLCEDKEDFARLYFQPAVGSKADTALLLLDATYLLRYHSGNDMAMVLKEPYPNVEKIFEAWEDYKYFEKHVTPGQFPDTFGGVLNCFKTVCHHYNEYVGTSQSLAETANKFLKLFPTLPLHCFQLLEGKAFDFEGILLIMDQCRHDLCEYCKRPGHFARECPNVAICRNCGLPGHIASACTAESLCWNCRKPGHMASKCPNEGIRHTAALMPPLCSNCYKQGHIAAGCTNEKACNNCRKTGHLPGDCSNEPICNICNISGHVASQCPGACVSTATCM